MQMVFLNQVQWFLSKYCIHVLKQGEIMTQFNGCRNNNSVYQHNSIMEAHGGFNSSCIFFTTAE